MAGIYHPSRGGVRGGQDQFKWDDVKNDKDREHYLGHSLMVPTGKWQEGKDLIWYTRNKGASEDADKRLTVAEKKEKLRKEELQKVKDIEARAMAAALGHKSFSMGTTSLTAKELQEVLSRGQTSHGDGEKIQGMGYKKRLNSSNGSKGFGTEFEGGDGSQNSPTDLIEDKRSGKKKKKSKEKKSKKRKKKTRDESPGEIISYQKGKNDHARSRYNTSNERLTNSSPNKQKRYRSRSRSRSPYKEKTRQFNIVEKDKRNFSDAERRKSRYDGERR